MDRYRISRYVNTSRIVLTLVLIQYVFRTTAVLFYQKVGWSSVNSFSELTGDGSCGTRQPVEALPSSEGNVLVTEVPKVS